MNARKQRLQASHPEVVAMHARLNEVVRKTADGKHAEYLDGCFGTFPPRGPAKDDPVMASEVRDLRRLVDDLTQRVAWLEAHAAPKAREPSRTPLLDGVAAEAYVGGIG